jgi:hypothetical protein
MDVLQEHAVARLRRLQGYLAHKKQLSPPGPSKDSRYSLTVGSKEGGVSHERGTPVLQPLRGRGAHGGHLDKQRAQTLRLGPPPSNNFSTPPTCALQFLATHCSGADLTPQHPNPRPQFLRKNLDVLFHVRRTVALQGRERIFIELMTSD